MNKYVVIALAMGLLLGPGGGRADAGLVVADFNDLGTGSLNGQTGGTGFTSDWNSGTGTINVIPGDLTSSLYGITQSGTAQSIRGDYTQGREQNRALASSMTGTIWFSFLAENPNANSRAGISLNRSGNNPSPREEAILFLGTDLRVYTNDSYTTISNAATLGSTALVVGKMILGPGNDTLTLWVDPDLVADPNISNHTPVYDDSSKDFLASLDRVGALSYRWSSGGSLGGVVDNVRFSDTTTAFNDVAGTGTTPPPPPWLLVYDGFEAGGASPGAGQYQTTPDSDNGNGTNNNSLVNQGPALTPGFTGGVDWAMVSGTALGDNTYFRADPGGLGYTDAGGNVLDTTPGQVTLFRDNAGSYTHKRIVRSSNDSGEKPATMYFSALIEFDADVAGYLQTKWGDKTSIGIGFDSDGTALVNVGTTIKGSSAAAFAADTTHLLVGKIEDNGAGTGNDSVTLYVDPIMTDEYFNTPVLDTVNLDNSYYVANNASFPLAAIFLGGHSIENKTVQFDEFRVGATWADVVPFTVVPEPSTFVLAALGLLGLGVVGCRRRRR